MGKRDPEIWGIHARPGDRSRWLLGVLPFLLIFGVYMAGSRSRLRENPRDKLLPAPSRMAAAMKSKAFEADRRTGEKLLWVDTAASLKRLAVGIGCGALAGLLIGLNLGMLPGLFVSFQPVLTVVSLVPPLAVLPILFIVFGVDELSKVVLIFIGTFPVISRDILLAVRKTPREQIVKALSLGATQFQVIYAIVLPQILPRLLEAVRLTLGAAWLFLIASEAIAAENGLGYRIFLVRRYLAMDVIIPYTIWITLLGFALDYGLKALTARLFPWYAGSGE